MGRCQAGMSFSAHNGTLIIIVIIVLALCAKESPGHETIAKFLGDLATTRYPDCALFFVRHGGGGEGDELGGRLLAAVVQRVGVVAYYNSVYALPREKEVEKVRDKVRRWGSLNMSASSTGIKFKVSVGNYNRRGPVCKVVVGTVDEGVGEEWMDSVKSSISPVYLPMVAKDSDRWVWVTSKPSQLEPLLLSPSLPAKIKYKLGLSPSSSSGELVIRSVCFFCDNGSPQIVNFPHQHPSTFNFFPDYVLNLKGKLLRIACPAIKSRIEADPPYEGVNNANRGMWKTLFEDFLIPKFNFTYNVFLSTGKNGGYVGGGGTGLELPNGTWIGTVGDIVAGRADIGIITANTPKRIKVVTFTNSFFDISYLNFITTDGARVFSPLALLWPFDLVMWGLIGISTLAAFIIFKIITRSMSALGMDNGDAMTFARRGIVSHENWGLQHQVFFVMTSYLDQDCVLPRFTPLRCFVSLWLFFTLIITTVYRSKMVSLLAFPILEQLPLTFEELVGSKYAVGFIKHGDSAYNTLKASTDPVYVKLLSNMEIITGNGLECLERAVAKKYACIAYAFSTIYLKARNLSDSDTRKLVFAPETTYNIFMGLALEGGSIYKEGFERWLGWTRPFHMADLWEQYDMYYKVRLPKRAWWLKTNQTDKLTHSEQGESDDLTLLHISGAFYSLAGCLVICSLIFAHELVTFHWSKAAARARVWHRSRIKLKMVSKLGI